MLTVIKILLYLGAGALLVTLDLVYIRRVAAEFRGSEKPALIAPFRVIGKTETADRVTA